MSQFPQHTLATAPEKSKAALAQVEKSLGFVPNLFATFAASPAVLEGYLALSAAFSKTSLSATEQQVVAITVSTTNECHYCVAAHSVIAAGAKVDAGVIEALRSGAPLADAKLEALRSFTRIVVEKRGWPTEQELSAFVAAGYQPSQALELILGIGLKTISNYVNHIAQTPLDSAFAAAAWPQAA